MFCRGATTSPGGHLPHRAHQQPKQRGVRCGGEDKRCAVGAAATDQAVQISCGCIIKHRGVFVVRVAPDVCGACAKSLQEKCVKGKGCGINKNGPVEAVSPLQKWWNETVEFWDAIEITGGTPLEEDEAPEAK
eukprot:5587537-Amphidinium_carterae.1